jgi:hypothetical protein
MEKLKAQLAVLSEKVKMHVMNWKTMIWHPLVKYTPNISAETLGWLAVLILHSATIPSLLAMMQGLTDSLLPVDMVLLVWAGLTLLFVRASIQRDILNMVTIGLGFVVQSTMMALIFFK